MCLHRNVVNLYISYKLDAWSRHLNIHFTLGNCLFGEMKLIKNVDPDKYGCSGYGIRFDARSQFSLPDRNWSKNVVIFVLISVHICAYLSSSVHVHDKEKNILVLVEGSTQELDDTT